MFLLVLPACCPLPCRLHGTQHSPAICESAGTQPLFKVVPLQRSRPPEAGEAGFKYFKGWQSDAPEAQGRWVPGRCWAVMGISCSQPGTLITAAVPNSLPSAD